MFDAMKIARKIRETRISRNMTQMDLAEAMEVSYQAVSSWERGNSMPDISKLESLCDVLQLSVDELLGTNSFSRTVKKANRIGDGELTLEELETLASVLPPEELEECVKKAAEKLPKLPFSKVLSLAPFLGKDFLIRLLEKTDICSFEEILDLAPYLPKEALGKLIDKIPKMRIR